ncbi:MAG: tRNA pseudouridine(38-40) synthase TruA [Dehalococcoidales bacterium]|jgi:tRNA pseudouridine38-40 synthase
MVTGLATGIKVVLILEYNGANYHGSQYQANAPTVQGEIEKALQKLTGEKIRIKMASRTDAGVHAAGQVVGFRTDSVLPLDAFINGLNHYLPGDIAVKESFQAEDDFDVRRRAVKRTYKYYILNSATRSPMRQGFSCRVTGELDLEAMQQACRSLIGRHDFASFVSSAETARQKRTVRDVFKAEITRDGDMIVLEMVANSFLPHQVRNTVGSLIKVGQGRMTVEEFLGLVAAKTPGLAGPTAPADGLCLVRVDYPGPFEGDAK